MRVTARLVSLTFLGLFAVACSKEQTSANGETTSEAAKLSAEIQGAIDHARPLIERRYAICGGRVFVATGPSGQIHEFNQMPQISVAQLHGVTDAERLNGYGWQGKVVADLGKASRTISRQFGGEVVESQWVTTTPLEFEVQEFKGTWGLAGPPITLISGAMYEVGEITCGQVPGMGPSAQGTPADPSGTPAAPEAAQSSVAPSFDCAKASTKAENIICSTPDLASLDVRLMAAYRFGLSKSPQKAAFKEAQKAWLQDRRDPCADGSDAAAIACMTAAYTDRLHELQ